jgi:hypothetical protein
VALPPTVTGVVAVLGSVMATVPLVTVLPAVG